MKNNNVCKEHKNYLDYMYKNGCQFFLFFLVVMQVELSNRRHLANLMADFS